MLMHRVPRPPGSGRCTVGRATRNIEVFAQVPPTVFGLAAHVAGDADVNGDICVNGSLHVVGDPDFGAHDVHLHCGDLTEDFPLSPPPIYTDPAHFAGATYYYVKGTKIGSDYQARIYDAAGTDITFAMEDSLVGVTSYNAGSQTFAFDFDSDGEVEHYFNETTGIFSRGGGTGVVVNFGEAAAISPPGVNGISNVILDGKVRRSCIVPWKTVPENADILTIEGIGTLSNPVVAAE